MRIHWFIIAAGVLCAGVCQSKREPPKPEAERSESIFDRLSEHVWTNNMSGSFGHSEQLTLRRDGTYDWTRTSDVVERDQSGQWSFTATGKSAGLARLSASGDLPFEILDSKLRLGDVRFTAGDKIKYTDNELRRTASTLEFIPPRKESKRLGATAWVKTHPFDDFRTPDRIELDVSGVYRASYRDGECRHKGLWGLDCRSAERIYFVGWPDENDCDQRGGSVGLPHVQLEFAGDLLLLGAPYAPADKKPANTIFFVDRYGHAIRTRGEFPGKLTAQKPTEITFTHDSESLNEYTLKSLEIGFQKQQIVKAGSKTEGEIEWVLKEDLTGIRVTADHPYRHTVEVTPPFSGQAWLCVRPIYASISQEFNAYELFSARIAE